MSILQDPSSAQRLLQLTSLSGRFTVHSARISMRILLTILIASNLAYAALPAAAQDRQENARRILGDIRETQREASDSAREWARQRDLPVRIQQHDGHNIELVALDGRRPIYFTTTNHTAAAITGTRHLYPGERMNLDLTGAGLRIGIWDEGHVLGHHSELNGRVAFGDEAEESSHATHVAGTLSATGLNSDARGMAYEGLLTSYDWRNDATEMTNEAASGLLVSNHSYSSIAGWYFGDMEGTGAQWYWMGDPAVSTVEDVAFGRYDLQSVQYDRVTFTNPYYLPVVAAGNDRFDRGPGSGSYRALGPTGSYETYDVSQRRIPGDGGSDGYDSIAGGGLAKNVLTIGSVGTSGFAGTPSVSSFSSFGPTDEGRIKPDVMGLGERLFSLSADGTTSYARSSGTSMATPNVAGSLILLQEQYEAAFGTFMRAASLKGLVIHTATDLGRPGPDYATGWGLLNVEAAAQQIIESVTNPVGLLESYIEDGAAFGRTLRVTDPGPVRVTLSWTDHPSARLPLRGSSSLNDPTPHLRNDLDVRLTHNTSGQTFYPYVLDPSRVLQEARPGDNLVDPVEQIFIAEADTGSYTLSVTHKGVLYGGLDQWFTILVSGGRDESAPVGVSHLSADVSLEGIHLTWKTLFERADGRFVIERAAAASPSAKTVSDEPFMVVGEVSNSTGGSTDYEFVDRHSISGRYVYRLVFVTDGDSYVAAQTEVNLAPPDTYTILSNYPNPFRESTTIEIDLPKAQQVRIEVYDALGRQVIELHDGIMAAGRHRLRIEAESWAAGAYFVRVDTPNGAATHRMVLVR